MEDLKQPTSGERTTPGKAIRVIGIIRWILVGGIIACALYPLIGIVFLEILAQFGRDTRELTGWFGVGVLVTTFWGALWLAVIGVVSFVTERFTRSKIPTPAWFTKFTRVALVVYVILMIVLIIAPAYKAFEIL